jgi:hypothetical protein
MAYNFTAASTQYLNTASTPVTVLPLTIAGWFRRSTLNVNATVAGIFQSGAGPQSYFLSVRANNVLLAGSRDAGTFTGASSATTVSQNVWTHGCGVWASGTSKTAYLNGVAGSVNTSSSTPTLANTIGIGAINRATPIELFNGDLAEVGIWNAALTAEEVASLADGMTCDKVRPQSLVFYAPLVRDLVDVKGGLTITNNNTATVANHPRVYA